LDVRHFNVTQHLNVECIPYRRLLYHCGTQPEYITGSIESLRRASPAPLYKQNGVIFDLLSSAQNQLQNWCAERNASEIPGRTVAHNSLAAHPDSFMLTANVGTEGMDENLLFWDVFRELFVAQLVLHRFG
jgi:hypothetical protein